MLQVIVLGILQGLTEFLPVSSSGHLVVVPYLLSWPQPSLAFNVALHVGTTIAVIAYFAGDLWFLATRSFGLRTDSPEEIRRARSTATLLAIGSVPAALVGFFFEDFFEEAFQRPQLVAIALLGTAALLWGAETLRRRRAASAAGMTPERGAIHRYRQLASIGPTADVGRHEGTTSMADAFSIGAAQALAIIPGISRSGATIAAGMARGLSRQAAARFSFLLSIPIILGAGAFKARELLAAEDAVELYSTWQIGVGMVAAAISGFLALRFLLRLVINEDLLGFARYVVLFGALTFIGWLWLGDPSSI